MKYNSINEYFSTIQRRQFLPVFFPAIVLMVVYYLALMDYYTFAEVTGLAQLIAIAIVLISFLVAIFSLLLFKLMMRKVVKGVSLGERMDGYAKWSTIRFVMVYLGSWMIVLAFFMSSYEWISIAFLIHSLFYLITWPGRKRLCKDLRLSQTEREVIV
ncbi:MAG: hypothetical protein MUF68_04435 [Cyclobacteriaceae bacterium]|jgi:hypothetical protein|nr:hypothetical protein [Cyclobacteriaceae bacterium]